MRFKKPILLCCVILIILWSLIPLYWLVNLSFMSRKDVWTVPAHLFPPNPTFNNYLYYSIDPTPFQEAEYEDETARTSFAAISGIKRFHIAMQNSVIVATATTAVTMVLAVPAGYAFARFNFPYRKTLLLFILLSRAVPPISLIIPYYYFFKTVNLLGTYYGMILAYMTLTVPLITWIMAGFFSTLPRDVEKAARVDGCNRMQMLRRITLPLAKPGLMAGIILAFLISWNEYVLALFLGQAGRLGEDYLYLAPTVITGRGGFPNMVATMAIIYLLIPIAFAVLLQKYFVSLKIVEPGIEYERT